MTKPRLFTGIQASGTLTLGNYLGLIHNLLLLQEQYEIIVMIADLHSLTVPRKQLNCQAKIREIAALLYACGLKEDCKVFVQSQIKEHLELAWFLAPHVSVNELKKKSQYKNKVEEKDEKTGNLALLAYPVLMTADILLYIENEENDLVVVGQDQQQHCELVSIVARKFNNFYQAKLLKVPQFNIPQLGSKIMGLRDPQKKMSKSGKDYLGLLDQPEIVHQKIKKAQTDSETKIFYDPVKRPAISNLLVIYALLKKITPYQAEQEVNNLNHDQFKLKLIDLLNKKLTLIQKGYNIYLPKINEMLEKNNQYLEVLAKKKMLVIRNKVLKE